MPVRLPMAAPPGLETGIRTGRFNLAGMRAPFHMAETLASGRPLATGQCYRENKHSGPNRDCVHGGSFGYGLAGNSAASTVIALRSLHRTQM